MKTSPSLRAAVASGLGLTVFPAPATPPIGVDIGQDLDVIALRTQYSF